MMNSSTLHAPPVRYTSCFPASPYSYAPQVPPYFVLDLSKKPLQHTDKVYPSPKSSPVSYASPDEYECSECNSQGPVVKIEKEEFLSRENYPPQLSPGSISPTPSQKKHVRPFKCIGKDPLIAADYLGSPYTIFDDADLDSDEIKGLMEESAKRYAEFKDKMLKRLCNNNNTTTNHNMRRLQNNEHKINDADYLEKRRKNNEAAKRSRDARRNKQDDTAIRATFLEQENIMLRLHLKAERDDLERLRKMELEKR